MCTSIEYKTRNLRRSLSVNVFAKVSMWGHILANLVSEQPQELYRNKAAEHLVSAAS